MMKKSRIDFSILGESINLRFSRGTYEALRKDLAKDPKNEQFAFALFSQVKTTDGTVLVVNDVFFPDKNDLSHQTGIGVIPTNNFQATVYLIAEQRKQGILDIHTHPFQEIPHFSSIDHTESAKNAKYICQKFPYPVTQAMTVFNSTATAYDASIYDRSIGSFRTIDSIEVLGRRIEINDKGND